MEGSQLPVAKEVQITFGLKEVKFISFKFEDVALSRKVQIPADGYTFEFKIELKADEASETVNFLLTTTLFEKGEKVDSNKIATLMLSISFTLQNLKGSITKSSDGLITYFPDKLIEIGGGMAVSTARGMFAIKLQESIYQNAIVPMMDPRSFVAVKPV